MYDSGDVVCDAMLGVFQRFKWTLSSSSTIQDPWKWTFKPWR